MTNKRKAREAFGKLHGDQKSHDTLFSSNGISAPQLSAFAAARGSAQPVLPAETSLEEDTEDLVATIAGAPYDGHHSGTSTPGLASSATGPEAFPAAASKSNVPLSNFVRRLSNCLRDDIGRWDLKLKTDESATFVGVYDLEVLFGVVTVYGAMLHPGSGIRRVYAPSTSALPAVVSKRHDTVISITSVKSGPSSLGQLSPMFRNIFTADENNGRTFFLLNGSADDPQRRALSLLEIDDETKKVLSRLGSRLESGHRHMKVMAVGPKSSGKSTFNRLLCNMITSRASTNKCFYLDLDPGQPEFGPPGQLSLIEVRAPILGPSFTHHASDGSESFRLIRSHTIAATSFKDDPEHYLRCVSDLLRYAQEDLPLVINSCGWVAGLGGDILQELTNVMSISDIVLLEPVDNDLASSLSKTASNQLHRIPKRQRNQGSRSPAELRAMQTMAYFHQKPACASPKWISKPVSTMRHHIVPYAGEAPGIMAILSYGQAPHPDFLGETLEGSIIAINVLEDTNALKSADIAYTSEEMLPYLPPNDSGHTSTLDPRKSRCVGLALIRAIDVDSKTLHLLTPLSDDETSRLAEQSVVLIRGSFDSPDWAYQEDLHAGEEDADEDRPWVNRREDVGIEGAVWRLRHPPMAKDVR